MKSIIAGHLKPQFHPTVLLKTDKKPEGAKQAKADTYYCIMSMFAMAVKNGTTIVFDRNTYGCPGAYAGLTFGTMYDKAMGGYDTFSAFFARGLEDAVNPEEYEKFANEKPPHVKKKLLQGERFHTDKAKALKWISEDLPIYSHPEEHRVLKPLSELQKDEVPLSVIFTVNTLQLTTLMTLAGSIRNGLNDTLTPQGAACQMLGNYVVHEGESDDPRAVLGLIDLAARKTVKKLLPDDVLTWAVPWKLFLKLEEEAKEGIFTSPLWLDLQD